LGGGVFFGFVVWGFFLGGRVLVGGFLLGGGFFVVFWGFGVFFLGLTEGRAREKKVALSLRGESPKVLPMTENPCLHRKKHQIWREGRRNSALTLQRQEKNHLERRKSLEGTSSEEDSFGIESHQREKKPKVRKGGREEQYQ